MRIESVLRFVKGLLPFALRKSKGVSVLAEALVVGLRRDIESGQAEKDNFLALNHKGQKKVVIETLNLWFDRLQKRISITDTSSRNVVLIGREPSYRELINRDGSSYVAKPKSMVVMTDFTLNLPSDLQGQEAMIRYWLNNMLLAGISYEIKYS